MVTSDLAGEFVKPIPLYAKVKQAIIEKIYTGEWKPHDRVPSEAELVKQFSCSRMTANRALRELTAEGFLFRLQGVGSFVSEPKGQSALFEIHSIADEIISRSHQHSCKVLKLSEVSASITQAAEFSIAVGAPLYHSIILHYENDVPVQIEDRYVNAQAAPEYLRQDFSRQTAHDYLSRVAPLTEGEHIVEAVAGDARSCRLLQIEANTPCLLISRRTWSKEFIVSVAKLLFPGHRYKLKGHFSS
ncbi:histidine utilization repressor [Xenorhabdus nematophila]|uniref:Histidine utilization repressor n=1 Tax=Xenorhabdus nematophila (strain ATCC 19061 / DSM 3370 / CCUG 14189 / LMG 1036 / NCIMB 9965 / AN6) TaxID=406817 RepID=D3VKY2_XENNA|nr:histidine utilization repressor [Xenorhabdus nematophila]CEF28558.1 Histidine utilization repressor [Xenorhabdus nematophila str. Websteri]AYA39797.1 histidine utilization repressor [Xenorhabdus nematophila]KHD27728.1 histidine utilization repressor [Xenorhabdus nematophila]MBA0018362.1 histidine utilization repressor [Xenorhabdus nematophila]MCB4424890.1 histidine utilization repressor [Xenorhabdus nematophila]